MATVVFMLTIWLARYSVEAHIPFDEDAELSTSEANETLSGANNTYFNETDPIDYIMLDQKKLLD